MLRGDCSDAGETLPTELHAVYLQSALFLRGEGIEHRTTHVRCLQSNGFIERLYRALLERSFRVTGCTTWNDSVEQMQGDRENYPHHSNHGRPYQGHRMERRTLISAGLAGSTEQPPKTHPQAA